MKRKGSKPSRPRRANESSSDDVGYGRPPKSGQFKPGKSGNPKGRRPGSKNESTLINEILQSKVELRDGGKVRKVTVEEAILLRFRNDALKGDVKAANFLFNRSTSEHSSAVKKTGTTKEDQDILKAFADKMKADWARSMDDGP